MSMIRGFVYVSDSSGFREMEYRQPYRGRSVDRPDSGLVGDSSVRVSETESGDELSRGRGSVLRREDKTLRVAPGLNVTPLRICFGERE